MPDRPGLVQRAVRGVLAELGQLGQQLRTPHISGYLLTGFHNAMQGGINQLANRPNVVS